MGTARNYKHIHYLFSFITQELKKNIYIYMQLTKTGTGSYSVSNKDWMPKRAALAFAVSKTVSTKRMSTPPSSSPLACSEYAWTNSSNAGI